MEIVADTSGHIHDPDPNGTRCPQGEPGPFVPTYDQVTETIREIEAALAKLRRVLGVDP